MDFLESLKKVIFEIPHLIYFITSCDSSYLQDTNVFLVCKTYLQCISYSSSNLELDFKKIQICIAVSIGGLIERNPC